MCLEVKDTLDLHMPQVVRKRNNDSLIKAAFQAGRSFSESLKQVGKAHLN